MFGALLTGAFIFVDFTDRQRITVGSGKPFSRALAIVPIRDPCVQGGDKVGIPVYDFSAQGTGGRREVCGIRALSPIGERAFFRTCGIAVSAVAGGRLIQIVAAAHIALVLVVSAYNGTHIFVSALYGSGGVAVEELTVCALGVLPGDTAHAADTGDLSPINRVQHHAKPIQAYDAAGVVIRARYRAVVDTVGNIRNVGRRRKKSLQQAIRMK